MSYAWLLLRGIKYPCLTGLHGLTASLLLLHVIPIHAAMCLCNLEAPKLQHLEKRQTMTHCLFRSKFPYYKLRGRHNSSKSMTSAGLYLLHQFTM